MKMTNMYKKFFIETYGCQMNFSLSEQLNNRLISNNFVQAESPEHADIVIINACSVRQHAEDKVFQRINYFKNLKKRKDLKLIVTGCFAQNQKQNIKYADFTLGTYHINEIPDMLLSVTEKYVDTDMSEYSFMEPVQESDYPFRCMVDITVGCDNYCTYCIVPYVRGRQISRKSSDIIESIKKLTGSGVKEVTLLGQNVNSYGMDSGDISFAELLKQINDSTDIKRIKFLTSHPKDFTDDIIEMIFSLDKVSKYIHLPIQSGSNKILRLMNRKYTAEHYIDIIEKIKSYKQEFSISTDLLIGFPGETEKDFLETIKVIEYIRYDEAYMFKYSPRPHTAALKFKDALSEQEKKERLNHLIKIQKNIEKEDIKKHIGKNRSVLIEGYSKKNRSEFIGKDELNKTVVVGHNVKVGNFYNVTIKEYKGVTLLGNLN